MEKIKNKQITYVVLDLRNLRTLVGTFTERVSDIDGTGFGRETLEELVVYSTRDPAQHA